MLGRWQASSGDGYVRTAAKVVQTLQAQIASCLRASRGGPDIFGEHTVLAQLAGRLLSQGFAQDEAEAQVERLRFFGGPPPAPVLPGTPALVAAGMPGTPGLLALPAPATPGLLALPAPGSPAQGASPGHAGLAIVPALAPLGSAPVALAALVAPAGEHENLEKRYDDYTGYAVSVTLKKGFRRLHFVPRCGRRPGKGLRHFQLHGTTCPGPAEYDAVCRQCWPGVPKSAASESSGSQGSDSTSSSSGDSSED